MLCMMCESKGNTVFILLYRPAAIAIVLSIKRHFLSLNIAYGIRHEKGALEAVFNHGRRDGLGTVGLGVKEIDAAAFGGEGHVTVIPATCDVSLNCVMDVYI
jgi:acetylornithine deacetylase/succinyl-diaminopimelate desuccinylase-like protein